MEYIYLDHAATTPVATDVKEAMEPLYKEAFGNPSSIHALGRNARFYVDEARRTIAREIHAQDDEIIFTSSGTEANNLAIIGVAYANKHKGNHLITTNQEHKSVLNSMKFLEENGFRVTYLPVNQLGEISAKSVQDSLTDQTILVSVMHANNETGVMQPIEEISADLKEHQAYFHTDVVQTFGLYTLYDDQPVADLMSMSAHKINGPKGVGCLYVNKDVQISPILFGGDQERMRRSGTEDVPHITGFGKSVERISKDKEQARDFYNVLKNTLLQALNDYEVTYEVNGTLEQTSPTIVNLYFPTISADILLTNLDMEKIAAASGSACQAGSFEPSYVLEAMYGQDSERARQSIRFSFGENNTEEEMKRTAKILSEIIIRLKGMKN
ncbi:MAG TPA: cysteine desulfurase family protein [Bacillota bacterium]|nr:cysteine desulfurase family protein [Bacillota bacterium]